MEIFSSLLQYAAENPWTAIVTSSVVAVGVIFVVKNVRPNWFIGALRIRNKVLKNDFEKDKIYLYQFFSSKTIASISPFALKLETFIRMKGLKYESFRGIRYWSKKGQIPFIELNGEQIADSNIIIDELKSHFKVEDEGLNEFDKGISRSIAMMLENQTVQSYFYYRYVEDSGNFLATWDFIPKWQRKIMAFFFPRGYGKRLLGHGIGRHESKEIYNIGNKDLQALSDILGNKQYMFGDTMTTLDCYVFGHICQILYIPIEYPHKKYVTENCPNLVRLVKRIKEELWPDWDDICESRPKK